MIRLAQGQYVRPEAVLIVQRMLGTLDPDNWCRVLVNNDWINVNEPIDSVVSKIEEALREPK